jgi:hypothetical protein
MSNKPDIQTSGQYFTTKGIVISLKNTVLALDKLRETMTEPKSYWRELQRNLLLDFISDLEVQLREHEAWLDKESAELSDV